MSLAEQIRLITYLKSNGAGSDIKFVDNSEPIIITQHGEAKMVVIHIHEHENQNETMALLKLLALGRMEFQEGQYSDAEAFLNEIND